MSANLDLVRSIYAPWERGDFGSTEWARPEIEWVDADGPAPPPGTGVEGMADAWRDQLSAWADARFFVDEYRELDEERIVVLAHYTGRGKASSLELGRMRTKVAALFHMSGGRVTRLVIYWDRDRAFADLGLGG